MPIHSGASWEEDGKMYVDRLKCQHHRAMLTHYLSYFDATVASYNAFHFFRKINPRQVYYRQAHRPQQPATERRRKPATRPLTM